MDHPHRVVLLAGPSGSGKSYIAQRTGLPVLCLDDFYKDGDDPTLPRQNNLVDWDSPRSWDAEAAVETIASLSRHGKAEVPVYAIGADRRVATRPFEVAGSPFFIAEGIFAAEIVEECRRRGLLAGAYALRRPRGPPSSVDSPVTSQNSARPPAYCCAEGWPCCAPSLRCCVGRRGSARTRPRPARCCAGWPTCSPATRTATDQPSSFAYAGLITSSMIASRSSNGMKALFIALMVNHWSSFQP